MFDPTRSEQLLRHARKADWLSELARTEPRHFVHLARGVAQRRARGENGDASVGRIAERHAYSGIDDIALTAELRERGLEVLIHDRYVDARTGAHTRPASAQPAARRTSTCSCAARAPNASASP